MANCLLTFNIKDPPPSPPPNQTTSLRANVTVTPLPPTPHVHPTLSVLIRFEQSDTFRLWGGLVCCWSEVGGATADEGGRGPTSSGLECRVDTPGTLLSCSSACPRVANDNITRCFNECEWGKEAARKVELIKQRVTRSNYSN